MNCLILVPSLKRSGAETQAVDLANGLADAGETTHVCSFEAHLDLKDRLTDTVRIHHVNRRNKYDVSLISRVARLIDVQEIDVILGVMQFATMIASLAARQSTRVPPVVAGIHTTVNRGAKEELQDRLVYSLLLGRLPAVVFVCEYQRQYWVSKYPKLARSARVVHNGVNSNRFQRDGFVAEAAQLRIALRIPRSAFVFASIAAFRPEKGHRLLVDAFARLPTDAHLLLAGEGPERARVESAVSSAGMAGRVHFLGNVSDVRAAIVASDATVLPSTAVETFSMAMLESMALQVPMIASRIGGVGEAIVHLENGLLCSPGDSASLEQQMRYLVENPIETERLGRNAVERVAKCFTLERMVAGYRATLLETALTRGHATKA